MDNAAHLHLLFNHFPVVAAVLAVPLALLAMVLRRERGLVLASTFLLIVAAGSGWVSVSTGEKAMTMIENQEDKPWYDPYQEADVSLHEERAETATWVATAAAIAASIVLWLAHRRPAENPLPRPWLVLILVGAVATSAAMAQAANAGGVIMHREIRGDSLDLTKDATKPR